MIRRIRKSFRISSKVFLTVRSIVPRLSFAKDMMETLPTEAYGVRRQRIKDIKL